MPRRKLLSGNYEVKESSVEKPAEEKKDDEDFQRAALAKLGGSIAFVRGRKLVED